MAVAMALASIPKAKGAEILEQSCVAQSIVVGAEFGLYWPLVISLLITLLLVLVVLRLVLKTENEVNIVYSPNAAQDAEASVGQFSHLSPRIESSLAPVSAPLSSDSHGVFVRRGG